MNINNSIEHNKKILEIRDFILQKFPNAIFGYESEIKEDKTIKNYIIIKIE